MARGAIVRDIDVIKICRRPCNRRMTVVAIVAARNVSRVFARRIDAVVAGRARPQYLRVVDDIRRFPDNIIVAVLANVSR